MFAIDLNHPDVLALSQHAKLYSFKKGAIVLHTYDDTPYLHIVVSGLVKAYSTNGRGEETIIVIYGPDNIFPVDWIVSKRVQTVDFMAMTDCEVALIPQDIFKKFLNESPDISSATLEKVVEQYTLFGMRITNLEFKYARERMAYRLLVLVGRFGKEKNGVITLPHISQQDLASTINVSREGVNREMSRFERLGFVKYTSKDMQILDVEGLHKECGTDLIIPFFDRKLID
jgi:CRP-like cAMP-binding protein